MAYRTRNGRRVKLPRSATNGYQYLVALDGTRATFECQAGYRMTIDYGKGPVSRRVSAEWLRRMRFYWGMRREDGTRTGHVNGWCQRCANIADGAVKEKR